MAQNFPRWQLVVANLLGMLYTATILFGATLLNTLYTCPAVYGYDGCYGTYWFAAVSVTEIVVNMALFHYCNARNQVRYWAVKRSYFMLDQDDTNSGEPRNDGSNRQQCSLPVEEEHEHSERERQQLIESEQPPAGIAQPGFCVECNATAPHRSRHCPICQICVLRKDHHCYMTGSCVGLANQRYFIVFTFWASIGAAYAAWLNFQYLDRFFIPSHAFGWVYYIGPIGLGRWFLGYQPFFMALLGISWSICVMSAVGAFSFFVAQVFYTLEGYSMQDYHISRRKYNLSADGENWSERLALVFGRRWWLNFLVPQFWLPNQMTPAIARNIFLNVPKNV